jgi:hypothetical protein
VPEYRFFSSEHPSNSFQALNPGQLQSNQTTINVFRFVDLRILEDLKDTLHSEAGNDITHGMGRLDAISLCAWLNQKPRQEATFNNWKCVLQHIRRLALDLPAVLDNGLNEGLWFLEQPQ